MEIVPGMVVLGRYRVDSVLGTGGMGVVVRGTHIYMAQPVAIKFLKGDMVSDTGIVQRFLREAHATVRLRGDHIARVIDVGMLPDGTPYMVMEYLDGSDLNQILRAHGAQPPALVCDMLLQACEGIAEAHALGIVHRDLKPSNFYVTRRLDGAPLLKILDFGISKAPTGFDSELTKTQAVVGTPSYMAPEQMMSPRGVDHRADIWALGVVMYQLLTGRLPFQAEQYAELCIKVGTQPPAPIGAPLPPGLGEVLLRCLEKEPSLRYQTVAELALALSAFSTDPNAGYATADRTRRVLVGQGQGPTLSVGGGGGPGTPSPFTPAPRVSNSSIGGSAGQMMLSRTQVVGKRSLIIGGTAAIVVGVAGGAYLALRARAESADAVPHSAGTAPAPAPAPTPDPPAADTTRPAADDTAKTDPPAADHAATDHAATDQSTTDKAAADKQTVADKTAADKQAASDKKAADKQAAADKKAADKAAAAAARQAAADQKAADRKLAAAKAAADKKAAADQKAADKKLAADKAAAAKQATTTASNDDLFDKTAADKKKTTTATSDKKPTTDKKPTGKTGDDLFDDRR